MLRDRSRRVIAELAYSIICIRADDCDRPQVLSLKAADFFILQQYDAFTCCLQGKVLIRLRVHDLDSVIHVVVRIFKEAQRNFCSKTRRTARSTSSMETFPSSTFRSEASCTLARR